MAVAQVVGSGKTKDPYLAACLRNLWLLTASYDINLVVEHIQGTKNIIADLVLDCIPTSLRMFNYFLTYKTTFLGMKLVLKIL